MTPRRRRHPRSADPRRGAAGSRPSRFAGGTAAGFFRSLGIPAPELQAPFVATVELVGGLLLVLGLGTRFAAVPLAVTMAVAIATALWPDLEGAIDLLGKSELLYIVIFAWLAVAGAGAVSLDALVARARVPERR